MEQGRKGTPVLAQRRAHERMRPDLEADGAFGDACACLPEQDLVGKAIHLRTAMHGASLMHSPSMHRK